MTLIDKTFPISARVAAELDILCDLQAIVVKDVLQLVDMGIDIGFQAGFEMLFDTVQIVSGRGESEFDIGIGVRKALDKTCDVAIQSCQEIETDVDMVVVVAQHLADCDAALSIQNQVEPISDIELIINNSYIADATTRQLIYRQMQEKSCDILARIGVVVLREDHLIEC